MGNVAGPRTQIWCQALLTHWMCNGYRYALLDDEKVEGLCTCTCHLIGVRGIHGTSRGICMADDPERFEQARLVSWQLHERAGLSESDYPHQPTWLHCATNPLDLRLPSTTLSPVRTIRPPHPGRRSSTTGLATVGQSKKPPPGRPSQIRQTTTTQEKI